MGRLSTTECTYLPTYLCLREGCLRTMHPLNPTGARVLKAGLSNRYMGLMPRVLH